MIAIASKYINPLALPSLRLESRHNLPDKPAIYFVVDEDEEILYIGKALRLVKRWRGHHRLAQLEQLGNVRIAWMECEEKLISSFEVALIAHFNPPLNHGRGYRELAQNKKQSFVTPQKLNLYRGTLEHPVQSRTGRFNWQYSDKYKIRAVQDLKKLASNFQQIKCVNDSGTVKFWTDKWLQVIQEALEDKRDFDQTIKDCNEALMFSPVKSY